MMDGRERPEGGRGGSAPKAALESGGPKTMSASAPAIAGPGCAGDPLLQRARAGDNEAWGELYKRHVAAIFRFCRRTLPTKEDAEDATTEIFMKLREKISQYDPQRPFAAWLYKVAANHCWDLLRRRKIRQDLETGEVDEMPLEHPDPGQLDQMVSLQTSQTVRAALEKLPARARMALVLRYYADMNYDEIAEALGVRRAFVGVVLLRARHQLREALQQRGTV
jgi:RNA polymerase sigma-70 factor (ECF subfamily)